MAKQKSRFPSYGLVRGPSHEGGGVAGMVAGEQPVELEGGEWIIPKEAVPDYLPVLKQITNEGRAMQQMQNGNSAMDALIASASMEAGISQPKSPMFQDGGQINLRRQEMKLPYQDEAPYAGTDKIDDVIDIINSMSSNQVGGFGQALNPVSYYGMPEAGRLSKKGQSQLSEAGYNKYAGDEERETSTKAAIMFDLLQRGQYNNDLDALRQDFLKSDVRNISPKQEQGGMIDEYQDGGKVKIEDYIKSGRTYSGDEYNEAYGDYFGDKYGGGDVGLERAESYKYSPNALQKLLDVIPGIGGKRAYQRANDYREQVFNDPEASMRRDAELERGVNVSGRALREQSEVNDETVKDMFMTGSLQQATEDPRNFSYRMNAESMDDTMADQFIQGSDIGHQISDDDSKYRSVDPYNIAQSKAGKDLFGLIPMGYSGSVRKNPGINPQIDVASLRQQMENMRTAELIPSQEQGGSVNQYGHGGQMQPRKQQEIRNPETYGPPLELMGPDTTGEGFQQMLNQMRMRDVNQSINPFTGDSLDVEGDSLKLLQRMQKSKMPRAGRKSMQNGGRVDEQDFSGLNTLSRFPNFKAPMSNPEFEAHMQYGERGVDLPKSPFKDFKEALASGEFESQSGQDLSSVRPKSFMGSLERDNRVRPADRYEMVEDGVMIQKEVPKLSSVYMNSFGLETPLSRRQQSFLQRRAIAPETLNPQVKSLLGRALVQRLTNEPI